MKLRDLLNVVPFETDIKVWNASIISYIYQGTVLGCKDDLNCEADLDLMVNRVFPYTFGDDCYLSIEVS